MWTVEEHRHPIGSPARNIKFLPRNFPKRKDLDLELGGSWVATEAGNNFEWLVDYPGVAIRSLAVMRCCKYRDGGRIILLSAT